MELAQNRGASFQVIIGVLCAEVERSFGKRWMRYLVQQVGVGQIVCNVYGTS